MQQPDASRCLRRNTENSQLNAHRNTSRRERAKEVRLKGAEAITLRAGYSGTAPFCTQGQAGMDGKRCTVCSCSRRCAAGSAGKTKDQQAPFLPTHGGSGVVGSHANGHSHHVGQRRSQALDLFEGREGQGKRGSTPTKCKLRSPDIPASEHACHTSNQTNKQTLHRAETGAERANAPRRRRTCRPCGAGSAQRSGASASAQSQTPGARNASGGTTECQHQVAGRCSSTRQRREPASPSPRRRPAGQHPAAAGPTTLLPPCGVLFACMCKGSR